MAPQEFHHLFHPGIADAEVDIGKNNGFVVGFQSDNVLQILKRIVTAALPYCEAFMKIV